MITVFYYHKGRFKEYSRDFDNIKEARKFYEHTKQIKDKGGVPVYICSYICNTSYEMGYMERIYK